ncbi:hypothetical protein ACPPVO_22495 [Dactylosporangium sp. McL0621]|uniref:hypothetical protein n=1 Tax=Dactylosporangium sp. McL0621 TaxID=3415678 RepID=UPI003CF6EA96
MHRPELELTSDVRRSLRRLCGSGGGPEADAAEAVLSPVRGHFSHYGKQYNRGLLFGKYSGKFWVAGHVRGASRAEPKDYVLKPGVAA